MRQHSFTSRSARRALGVAGIVGFVALALCSDASVLTRFHIMNTAKAEDSLIGAFRPRKLAAHATLQRGFHSSLGDEGAMPDLDGAIGWLNSVPLSRKSLRGKVVLVNFWTYTCINSIRPLPYLRNWAAKYKDAGFVVIGVHTPEFSFEHEPMNVETAVRNLKVTFSGRRRQQHIGSGNRSTTNIGPPSISSTRKGEFGTTTLAKAIMATSSASSRNS